MLRRLRRFATLLMGVLLLQVSFLGASTACALPATDAASTVPAAAASAGHDAHAHHGADAAHVPVRDDASPTRQHGGELHCPTAMACAVTAVVARAPALPADAPTLAVRVPARDAEAPASIVGAPEPPPPRA